MYFKRIFSKGLAHYSYMVGDGNEIAVIDPRRDVQVYIDEAAKENKRITHIFETHRNEDIISGSIELSEATGAEVHISKYEDLEYVYGNKIGEEDVFEMGNLKIVPIHTPGHTKGHLSYLVKVKGNNFAVFTGDCLFYGDIGRTDFYGEDYLEEMTGKMYDSIYNKLFKLGDEVAVYPAHGPGSACGGSIDSREVSTIGYERKHNDAVKADSKKEFIEKNGYMRMKPPYFEYIEVANIKGAEKLGNAVKLNPVAISEIDKDDWNSIIDIRPANSHIAKRIPKTVNLHQAVLSGYLGWMKCQDEEIYLLSDGIDYESLEEMYWSLRRMGYDNIKGILGNGSIHSMMTQNFQFEKLSEVSPSEYLDYMKENSENAVTIDVRKEKEMSEEDNVINRINLPLETLSDSLDKVPEGKKLFTVCNSGNKATVALSVLKAAGIEASVIYGGTIALNKLK